MNIIPWFALTAIGCCASAAAQSGVTLYGQVDAGLVGQTNRATGGTLRSVDANVWNPSQLGWRGQEDLGDGTLAVFDMASTVRLDLGAEASATKFFDRHAYVGLSDSRWGALTLGRQLNTLAETLGVVDPLAARSSSTNMSLRFGYLGGPGDTIASHFGPNPGVAGANLDRVDNALKYSITSAATGLLATAMVAAGGGTGGGRAAGALLGYDGHGANLRGSFMRYKDDSGIAFNAFAGGGAYKVGEVTWKISFARNKIDSGLQTEAKPYGHLETQVAAVGVVWTWSNQLDLNVALYRGKRTQDHAAAQVARKFYLVPEYRLSKRTSLVMVAVLERFNATGAALDTGTPLAPGTRSSNYLGTAITHAF